MAASSAVIPSTALAEELRRRGGSSVARCYQCATCSSVCELAPEDAPFPRRQVLWAQWGLTDRLARDPSTWLCYQCNDCSERCPRDVRPGDVLQAVRSLLIESLAYPRLLGRFVGRAGTTWPLLLGVPILFWVALLAATGHLAVPPGALAFGDFVPHSFIYAVFFPVAGWVLFASWTSGRRFWTLLGDGAPRAGSFQRQLLPVLIEIATHKRFASCETTRPRRLGHLLLLWGFVGAAVTSGLLVVALYGFHTELPLPQGHPFKILGNVSAALLVVGGALLVTHRLTDGARFGTPTAFDIFFLAVVGGVIATGVLAEAVRLLFPGAFACSLYVVHLGLVLSLFLTFPYSKFAHLMYRALALVHIRMLAPPSPGG
jgi:quinone-modifying oxidoreductase subunit QmoC